MFEQDPQTGRTLAVAHHLADAAGDILRRHFRRPLMLERKSDESPVTLADRECESALRALIEANCPLDGILGEEFGPLREDAPLQWVLDPIDGTRSFLAGYPIFCTLIALAENGVPQLGIVDQPVTGERWVGVRGEGASLNGRAIATRDCTQPCRAFLATTSIDIFSPSDAKLFAALKEACASSVLGGDAYAYAMLAGGQIDLIADADMKPYDYCAVVPLIEEAGGVITDWQGERLTLHSDGHILAAGSPALHAEALKVLQSAV